MPHHDDKGRISPAQSKAAKAMRGTPLSERTMGQMGDRGYGGNVHGRHAYGETHVGISGMTRMSHLKATNKGKKAKSRVILRGQKDEGRREDVKGQRISKKHHENMAKKPFTSTHGGTTYTENRQQRLGRQRLKVIARGQKSSYRKSYTETGARMHRKGLLHVPKVEA